MASVNMASDVPKKCTPTKFHVALTALLLSVMACCAGCSTDDRRDREEPSSTSKTIVQAERGPHPKSPQRPDPEEQRRRTEALRRAAEELATRRIPTDGYLMNLIAEDDSYRIAFVKRAGTALEARITVRVRREDFEILSVEGADIPSQR